MPCPDIGTLPPCSGLIRLRLCPTGSMAHARPWVGLPETAGWATFALRASVPKDSRPYLRPPRLPTPDSRLPTPVPPRDPLPDPRLGDHPPPPTPHRGGPGPRGRLGWRGLGRPAPRAGDAGAPGPGPTGRPGPRASRAARRRRRRRCGVLRAPGHVRPVSRSIWCTWTSRPRPRGGNGRSSAPRMPSGTPPSGSRRAARLATRIAVGHTLDDQAETVVLRFLRGAGTRGLAGMWPSQGLLIRPLLEVRRADVERYAAERGLTWRDDASNLDTRHPPQSRAPRGACRP